MTKLTHSLSLSLLCIFASQAGLAADMSSPPDSLVVDTTGNVGVGTSAPTSSLHVKKAGAVLTVEDTNGTAGIRNIVKLKNKGGVGFELTDTSIANTWEFRSGGGGTFTVANTGVPGGNMLLTTAGGVLMGLDVAGGSTSSNFYLKPNGDLNLLNGDIYVSGTKLNVPDYVFEKDYKLMPLDQLQAYVNKEKHLPNVASKSDIKKAKLVKIGKSQMTHLEKIEELTLYTLQQHEQIKILTAEASALRQKVAENTKMKERLATLEKLVTNLASSEGVKSATGKKVALK